LNTTKKIMLRKSIQVSATYFLILLLLVLPLSNQALAENVNETEQTNITKQLNQLLNKNSNNSMIGIAVQAMDTGKIVYQKNADQLFSPASTLKLFTAAASTAFLGDNFHYKTVVLSQKNPDHKGLLQGNIYVLFGGDPTLTKNDIKELMGEIKENGINTIDGNLILDDTIFDQVGYGPGWMWDELNFCYAAPLLGIMIDKNCFSFLLSPAQQPNDLALITNAPDNGYTPIINTVSTVEPKQSDMKCPLDLHVSEFNQYYLSGCMPQQANPKWLKVAVKNIHRYVKAMTKDILKNEGIQLSGRIEFKKAPNNHHLHKLAEHDSATLNQLLVEMLKHSDNLIADTLFKTMGAIYFNKVGTWQEGARAVDEILSEKTGIDFDQLRLVDGSGISRYNLMTPRQMILMLNYIYHNAKLNTAIITALPESGIDGTLESRMAEISTIGKVHAKTGTLKGVSTLAGFITNKKGQVFAFTIFFNRFLEPEHEYQDIEDKICQILAS